MKSTVRRWGVVGLALVLIGAAVPMSTAAAESAGPNAESRSSTLNADLDKLVDAGVTGAIAESVTPAGREVARAGVGDRQTKRPVPRQPYINIGSSTKTFVAIALLQLVDENKIGLDDTVESHLPGVVQGNGNDGTAITIRQLLNHTSGLPDYLHGIAELFSSAAAWERNRGTSYSPEQKVAMALTQPPLFPPGEGWKYTNTNYLLAGMLIERVTGNTWQHEVEQRIIEPAGLRHTSTRSNFVELPRPHARNYQQFGPDAPFTDTTAPTLPLDTGADGAMISTTGDMNTFWRAWVAGRLLSPAMMAEQQQTVAVPDVEGQGYGLGVQRTALPCGSGYWNHGGNGIGYETDNGVSADGKRSVEVSLFSRPGDPDTASRQLKLEQELINNVMC